MIPSTQTSRGFTQGTPRRRRISLAKWSDPLRPQNMAADHRHFRRAKTETLQKPAIATTREQSDALAFSFPSPFRRRKCRCNKIKRAATARTTNDNKTGSGTFAMSDNRVPPISWHTSKQVANNRRTKHGGTERQLSNGRTSL